MTPQQAMQRINELGSHIWMVRTFLKHSEEAAEDEELMEVPRELYDFMLALGAPWAERDEAAYLKTARKKFGKLKKAVEHFAELQPEISNHTNFEMALLSLRTAAAEIGQVLEQSKG